MIATMLSLDMAVAQQWERAILLLGPLILAGALVIWARPTPREASAAMLAFLWQMASLLPLNVLAAHTGWWTFSHMGGATVLGLPVDIWVGWAFWWGPVPALLEKRLGIPVLMGAAAVLDAVGMPLLSCVSLSDGWFWGEPVLVGLGLLPGLLLARWTRLDQRPLGRTLVHATGWGTYMLFVLPAVALAVEGRDLVASMALPEGAIGWAGAALLALSLLAGATAAFEFATVGKGTPVPVDPPKRVVMTGPYAYVANPMQVTSAIVMAVQALHYRSPGLAFVTGAFLLFDAVYAAHYNKVHIARAMPREWEAYKAAVPDWRVRWTPYRPGTPLVIARSANLLTRSVAGFIRLDAGLALRRRRARGFSRLSFVCWETGVRDRGISAMSRILERRSLPWAFLAWGLRMPFALSALQGVSHAGIGILNLFAGHGLRPARPVRVMPGGREPA